jgi:hypothetical protein
MDTQLQQLFTRLGELDTVAADVDRERDQVRAAIAQRRAALQATAPSAAETPTVPMRKAKR